MSIIVEDGTGISNAETYISVADTDVYLADIGTPSTSWASLSISAKEIALRVASAFLDMKYMWKGSRIKLDQGLSWPRIGVIDNEGFSRDSVSIPKEVRNATAEMALRASNQTLFPDQETSSLLSSDLVKVGPITLKSEFIGGEPPDTKFTKVDKMLEPLIESIGATIVIQKG